MKSLNRFALPTTLAAAAVAAAVMLPACESSLTGNEGNLTFSYIADENFFDFNKPIAVGAMLDLRVRQVGTNQNVTLTDAFTMDTDLLEVVGYEGNIVTVRAIEEGNVLLEVEAMLQNGQAVPDSVNLNTRVPDELQLRHSCTEDDITAYYLADERQIWIAFEMLQDNGRPVIGYGYFPVDVEPASAMTLDPDSRDPQWIHFTPSGETGAVTISSQIDDTTLSMELIEPAAIDGAMLIGDYGTLVELNALYYLIPTSGGAPICQADTPFDIEVTTPEICDVMIVGDRPEDDGGDDTVDDADALTDEEEVRSYGANEVGWIRVDGFQVGVCEFNVNYTLGNGGEGTNVPLSVDVIDIERPGDGSGEGAEGSGDMP